MSFVDLHRILAPPLARRAQRRDGARRPKVGRRIAGAGDRLACPAPRGFLGRGAGDVALRILRFGPRDNQSSVGS